MNYLIWGVIALSVVFFLSQLFFIVKDFFNPYINVKEKATNCAEKSCAFYKVKEHSNTVQEIAFCHIAVNNFDNHRGSSPCKKSIRYNGKTPEETFTIIKKRKRDFMTSFSTLAGWLALILSLYRILNEK